MPIRQLKEFWDKKPLPVIMIVGGIARLIAVVFSKGYGMHDDHFAVIGSAQSWLDGVSYFGHLVQSYPYTGFFYLLFRLLEFFGIDDPMHKMTVVRFLSASVSMFTLYFGYRISLMMSGDRSARTTGLLLALFWLFPFFSVRTLIEMACVPFAVVGVYLWTKGTHTIYYRYQYFLWAGVLLGFSFIIRYQMVLFVFGFLSGALILLKIRKLVWVITGFALVVLITQGLLDFLIFGQFFHNLIHYIEYNLTHAGDYVTGPWYLYLLTLSGILIPPLSLLLITGTAIGWKNCLPMVLGIFVFLLFHSIFPNKQERFILPIVPFIMIAGVAGWNQFLLRKGPRASWIQLTRISWGFFWVVNTLLLVFTISWFSKKARVESMYYFHDKELHSFYLDDPYYADEKFPPVFYANQWPEYHTYLNGMNWDSVADVLSGLDDSNKPQYLLFYDERDIEDRVKRLQAIYPQMKYDTIFRPSLMDVVFHKLNRVNANVPVVIYKMPV